MKIFGLSLLLFLSSCLSSQKPLITAPASTNVKVVQLNNMHYEAESFFGKRENISFAEAKASQIYDDWATDAIHRVNDLIPAEDRLPTVKLKLIFSAAITSKNGKTELIPISIIESYQEPKTASIRLGMEELKNSKESFQLTVAHEYAHLVFESASRRAGTTTANDDNIGFWPKSVYEGVADLVMSLAMNSDVTAAAGSWPSRNIKEFGSIAEARSAKDDTIQKARAGFKELNLYPKYKIYGDWLSTVDLFIRSQGGVDPYAEGRWFAGSIKRRIDSLEKRRIVITYILESARSGQAVDLQVFHDGLLRKL